MRIYLVPAFAAGCGVMAGILALLNPDPPFHSFLWAALMFGLATTLAIGSIVGVIHAAAASISAAIASEK